MAVSAFNLGGGVKRIANIVYTYKASHEYDGGAEQKWTATRKCWVVVSTSTGAARGAVQYIRKNGQDVTPSARAYAQYGYAYAFAAFEANKGDVITVKPYGSDTGSYSYVSIQAFA